MSSISLGVRLGSCSPDCSAVELAVDDAANAAAGAKGIANEVAEALVAAVFLQFVVYFRKGAAEGLSKGKEVSVVVDEHGNAEDFPQVRSQGHAVTERREVGQETANDAGGIVCGAGESEADGLGLYISQQVDDRLETGHHGLQAQVQVVGVGREGNGIQNEFFSLHGVEAEGIAACIQGQDHAGIVFIFSHRVFWLCRSNFQSSE